MTETNSLFADNSMYTLSYLLLENSLNGEVAVEIRWTLS